MTLAAASLAALAVGWVVLHVGAKRARRLRIEEQLARLKHPTGPRCAPCVQCQAALEAHPDTQVWWRRQFGPHSTSTYVLGD